MTQNDASDIVAEAMKYPRPLGPRVVLRPIEPNEMFKGIFIPSMAQADTQRGEIVAIGPGGPVGLTAKVEPIPLEIGDVVIYNKYGVTEIELNAEKLLILKVDDVLAVV